jgi:hypothetical protein
MTAVKTDRDYLIGAIVILETDCLPILGMISGCSTLDIAMLRWIVYIKSLNPQYRDGIYARRAYVWVKASYAD